MLARAEGLLSVETLQNTHVVIIGVGSVGSWCAQIFNYYDLGRMDLIDPDVFEKENIERHALGFPHVGQNKAEAMRDFLISHSGFAPDRTYAWPMLVEEAMGQIPVPDYIICAVDDEGAQIWTNKYCMMNDVPALYPGVYGRGSGGNIFVLPSPNEVCWMCATLENPVAESDPGVVHDYGVPLHASLKEQSALQPAVVSLSRSTVHLLIGMLNGESMPSQIFEKAHTDRPIRIVPPELHEVVANFVYSQPELGIDLFRYGGDGVLRMICGSAPQPIRRHPECTLHEVEEGFSLDDL